MVVIRSRWGVGCGCVVLWVVMLEDQVGKEKLSSSGRAGYS